MRQHTHAGSSGNWLGPVEEVLVFGDKDSKHRCSFFFLFRLPARLVLKSFSFFGGRRKAATKSTANFFAKAVSPSCRSPTFALRLRLAPYDSRNLVAFSDVSCYRRLHFPDRFDPMEIDTLECDKSLLK